MYVRKKDLLGIDPKHRPDFRTKLELAVELLRWAGLWLGLLGKPLWVVADGAYAKAAFLKPAIGMGMPVVSRLRRDAALWTVPEPRPKGRRGRPWIYGEHRIELAKRAGQRPFDTSTAGNKTAPGTRSRMPCATACVWLQVERPNPRPG
jgi:hypothetical protein